MSHVIVSSEKVIKVCEAMIENAKEMKTHNLANMVYEEAHRKHWFSKPIGYEKALARVLENDHTRFELRIINATHNETIQDCKKLIILAKIGDPVVITDSHAYIFRAVLYGNK